MLKPLRYGLIGCGMMGREHLRNIALLDHCNVTKIFEPNADMRSAAGAIAPDAEFLDNPEDVVTDDAVDCLVITSPNHLHLPQLELIARLKPKPVLVEKPLYTAPEMKTASPNYKNAILLRYGLPWNIATCQRLLHF